MNLEEVIAKMVELKEEGRVRAFDYYEGKDDEEAAAFEDGFTWVDEIDSWVKLDD